MRRVKALEPVAGRDQMRRVVEQVYSPERRVMPDLSVNPPAVEVEGKFEYSCVPDAHPPGAAGAHQRFQNM